MDKLVLDTADDMAAASLTASCTTEEESSMDDSVSSTGSDATSSSELEAEQEAFLESLFSDKKFPSKETNGAGLVELLEQFQLSVPQKSIAPEDDNDFGRLSLDDPKLQTFLQNRPEPVKCFQSVTHRTAKTCKVLKDLQTEDCSIDQKNKATTTTKKMRSPASMLGEILNWPTEAYPAKMWDARGLFLEVTKESMDAYTVQLDQAVRTQDYAALRAMVAAGVSLQGCNQHGESIVHRVGRSSNNTSFDGAEMLRFLIQEGQVSVQVRDDFGRTPLHDTCWGYTTTAPSSRFKIFKTLVETCPELLFVRDKRDCSPFDYTPCECWEEWCDFLLANADFLRTTVQRLKDSLTEMELEYSTFWRLDHGEKRLWSSKRKPSRRNDRARNIGSRKHSKRQLLLSGPIAVVG